MWTIAKRTRKSILKHKVGNAMCGFGKTDVGRLRANNEDAFYVNNNGPKPLENLYIIADGMGGHNAGDVASSRSISEFCNYVSNNPHIVYTEDYLAAALIDANSRIHASAIAAPHLLGMGTTFSVCTIDKNNMYYAHVGDSRIYVINNQKMLQITKDHSLVAEMAEKGMITEEEARHHPDKNVITRAIGTDSYVNVDKGYFPLDDVSYILMCSDGLTNMVSDADIKSIIASDIDTCDKVDKLVFYANQAGGDDNISVVLVAL